jgi:large repetitive protein
MTTTRLCFPSTAGLRPRRMRALLLPAPDWALTWRHRPLLMPTVRSLAWSIWPGNGFPANSGAPATSVGLGQPSDPGSPLLLDARQHPYWRIEMLERVMNLTTVRTHHYAVWITVGFFEVKRQGEVVMIASSDPRPAFDVLGPEIGLPDQKHRRYRGFFLIDRLKLDGFDPTNTRSWHRAVVYRQSLQ